MPRPSLYCCLPVICLLTTSGCGGQKTDFAVKPASYALTTASPVGATAVVLNGIARDGRLVGSYSKAGKTTVFGWSADGPTTDLTLPTECKSVDGIDELGTVACSDRTVTPNRLYLWSGGDTTRLTLPTSTTLGQVSSMSFEAGLAANLQVPNPKTYGYQLNDDKAPLAVTTVGGLVRGTSLSGSIAGSEPVGALFHAIVFTNGKKLSLGLFGGRQTFGNAVNDFGDVVGAVTVTGISTKAFKWSKGKYTELKSPTGATSAEALDINNEGVVSGDALIGTTTEACLWFPATGPVLVKSLVTLPSGVHLDRALLTTPLGIVICDGSVTVAGVTNPAVFALEPTYP